MGLYRLGETIEYTMTRMAIREIFDLAKFQCSSWCAVSYSFHNFNTSINVSLSKHKHNSIGKDIIYPPAP